MDPTSADSNRWMYCHHCGFRGDSLELYALTRRTRDMFDTVERASTDGSFTLEASDLTPEAVFNYIEYFPVRRRKTEALWKQFRAGLGPRLSADLSRRMQNMHLWSTWNYGQGMIGRFMGGATRHEVNKAFGEEILPKEGFRTALIFNYQDVPGRTIGMQFVGETERRFKAFQYNYGARSEGGLAMLDAGCNVGDLVPRVQGRGLDLAAMPGFIPHVVAVEHRGGEEWVTHLKVSG